MDLKKHIKTTAIELGFNLVGITTAEPVRLEARQYFEKWLREDKAADMDYMHRHIEQRFDPRKLLNDAKSVICIAVRYATHPQDSKSGCRIASFALYEDYHQALRRGLHSLVKSIQEKHLYPFEFKVCVDSVPLAERSLAQRAGLGFIGRSRMLIHPQLGNHLLLGEVITPLELEPDEPMETTGCRGCRRCIEACPTKALGEDFDASRCISYLTIENKGEVAPEYESKMDGYIFGCDECLKACPFSQRLPDQVSPILRHHAEWLSLTRRQILDMTGEQFKATFANSGLIRLGLERLKRNCRAGLSSDYAVGPEI